MNYLLRLSFIVLLLLINNSLGGSQTKELYRAIADNDKEKVEKLLEKGANIYDDRQSFRNETPLHIACQHANYEIVKLLIDRGAKVNVKDKYQWTPLHYLLYNYSPMFFLPHQIREKSKRKKDAIKRLKICKLLIHSGIDINSETEYGETPLLFSAQYWPKIAIFLIEKGANVNASTRFKSKAINYAVYYGYSKLFFLLVKKGADYRERTDQAVTLLHEACEGGSLEIVKFLVKNGLNPLAKTDNRRTPLHYASSHVHFRIIKYLIDKGAKINAQDINGKSPIHLLCYKGMNDGIWMEKRSPKELANERMKCVQYLIKKGAKINILDKNKRTPLYYYSAHCENIALFLLNNQADFNQADNYNDTPLNRAILNGNHILIKKLQALGAKIPINQKFYNNQNWIHYLSRSNLKFSKVKKTIEILLNEGMDINEKDNGGVSPLHLAALDNNLKMCDFLVNNGIDINVKDKNNKTPLMYHVEGKRSLELFKFFQEHKANFSMKDNKKNNLIHYLARSYYNSDSDSQLLNILIKKKISINEMNIDHETPLHYAVARNKKDLIRILVNEKARLNVLNKKGKTPLDYCRDLTIRKLLRNAGAKKNKEFTIDDKTYIKMIDTLLTQGFSESNLIEAPDFKVKDMQGKTIALSDLKGKIIFINFWATWCGPCIYEMPYIASLKEKINNENFVILAITREEDIKSFLKENSIKVPVYTGAVSYKYYVRMLPTTYIIDHKGRILGKYIGAAKWDDSDFVNTFNELLQMIEVDK